MPEEHADGFVSMMNPDGSWNWDALERYYAGELSRAEIQEIFPREEPTPEPPKLIYLLPDMEDEIFVRWLIEWALPHNPQQLYDLDILWRLQKIKEHNPRLYGVFCLGARMLK